MEIYSLFHGFKINVKVIKLGFISRFKIDAKGVAFVSTVVTLNMSVVIAFDASLI